MTAPMDGTRNLTDAREQVIAGLEAAIRDVNCPLQYSPLMMEAAKLLRKASPPAPTEGQCGPENRMAQIETVIADLQSIRDRFGNTCVYIRRYGFSWGAVALNYKADDEKNGVFKLNEEYDRRLIAHSEQVDRLKASRDEAYARADKAEKDLAALRAVTTDRPAEALAWAVATFGAVAKDRREHTMRFLEEAFELAHALDIDRDTVKAIAQRVWSRDKGYIPREVGQAQMTLEALAASIGHDADREAANEFDRVRKIPKGEWETRHAAKVAIGIAQPQHGKPTEHQRRQEILSAQEQARVDDPRPSDVIIREQRDAWER